MSHQSYYITAQGNGRGINELDPRKGTTHASLQYLYAESQACSSQPYVRPDGMTQEMSPENVCDFAHSSAINADNLLKGGHPESGSALSQTYLTRYETNPSIHTFLP